MRVNQFIPGYVSQEVQVESKFTDYEIAVMEGGLSLDRPKSALREAIANENFSEAFTNYQGVRPPKNVPGTNLFPGQDIVGQRVYHCTNRLEAIKKSGGLKPRRDATGEREYGRLSTDEHPFIPVIGIWFSVGKPDWPGKHCVSFVIEPTDQVYVAYANSKGLKPNVVLNPIALDRLTVEGQQDVAENFADGQNPGRKELDPDVYEDLANGIIARRARQIVPTIRAKSTPEGYVYLSTQDGLSLVIGCNIAGGSIDINIGSQPMETTSSGPHKGAVTKIIAAVYQAAVKRYGQPTEQGTLSIDHDAGHGVWQHIAQKLGLQYDAHMVKENFADGRHPEDKGDSARHGIPKHASLSQLDKISHEGGRRGQLAHWQANMRRGRAKNESEILDDLEEGWKDWVAGAALAPKVNNFNDTAQVTKPINSGLKGLDDRHNKYASIMALMSQKS